MKKYIIYIVTILVLIFIGYLITIYFPKKASSPQISTKTYESEIYSIAFTYPDTYLITEKELRNDERGHYAITLIEDTPENRKILNGESIDRDGPVSITFDIYQNNIDKQAVIGWIRNSSNSNFKLGDERYGTTTIDNTFAFSYNWSGLYEVKTIALAHKENIIAISATYISPEDQILKDFTTILRTIKLNY